MTSSSLQFGPEWMRKAPAKSTTTPTGPASTAATVIGAASQPHHHSTSSTKRNPSLGAMNGPAPVLSPAAAHAPGGFSFAAAAAGGVDRSSSSTSGSVTPGFFSNHTAALNTGNGTSRISSRSRADDRESSLRYAKDQALSLYSSKETLSPNTEGQPSLAPHPGASDTPVSSHFRKKVVSKLSRHSPPPLVLMFPFIPLARHLSNFVLSKNSRLRPLAGRFRQRDPEEKHVH